MSPNVTVRFSSLSVLDKWATLSQSIKSPESCSSASRRSNNIFVRATAARAAILSLIAQILVEPITRRASSVAPCSHFCSNRQCSTDVQGLRFRIFAARGAKCCIGCAGCIQSVDSVGSRIRMQVTNFLVDPLLPRRTSAQVFIRTVVHVCVDDVPVSDDRLVGALIDVSFSCSAVFILRALVRLLSIFKFNSSIFNP
ncbi:hypothetical protein EVAR_5003_1 [Eumeta japonica]|uniref:Uncharacterized protein n=1 Tax=Eumeta variegata TaxID=151549 RepID=A0A4C1V129_EUMVA|nr:hypothetical protein EVAR_5003_1 [Eumeta japonica]